MSTELNLAPDRTRSHQRAIDQFQHEHYVLVGKLGDLEVREILGEDVTADLESLRREEWRLRVKTWLRLRVLPESVRTASGRAPAVSARPRERRARRAASSSNRGDPDEPEPPLGRRAGVGVTA